ncbi:RNA polymerase sigma factor [Halobacillus fulvus]|nr:RNA polymerase sigma factor [Halobacillus fulvus]
MHPRSSRTILEGNQMGIRFPELYETYYHRVYYTALSIMKDAGAAEDVLQETFIKAFHKLDEVKEDAKVGAWLCKIASRKAIDSLRKQKRTIVLPVEEWPPACAEPVCESDVEDLLEQKELERVMTERISSLPPKLGAVFQLYFYEGLKEKEIADRLSITQSAVKSRLHRARLMLRERVSYLHNIA